MSENHRSCSSVLDEMDEVFIKIGKFMSRSLIDTDISISPVRFCFLLYLYRKDKSMVNDLAAETGTSSGATSLALSQMEKCGLVERERDQEDRRVVWIRLTSKGKKTVEDILESRREVWVKLMEPLSDTEREIFLILIRKIASYPYT